MKTFKNGCAGCHGDADGPSHWGTTAFYPRVPQFVQQPPRLTEPQMFWVVKHGVRYTGMAAWDGLLSDDETWKSGYVPEPRRTLAPPRCRGVSPETVIPGHSPFRCVAILPIRLARAHS